MSHIQHNVILTFIRRRPNVTDVEWTLTERCVRTRLTGSNIVSEIILVAAKLVSGSGHRLRLRFHQTREWIVVQMVGHPRQVILQHPCRSKSKNNLLLFKSLYHHL